MNKSVITSYKPCVSVVMPVYNAERFLDQSIKSVLDSDLTNIEVVCVDDGSTDSSREILNSYARLDHRVRVIHTENAGYGHAMNLGVSFATGEYIGVVEPDDWVEPAMFSALYKMASQHRADIVKANYFENINGEDHFMEVLQGLPYNKATSAWDNVFIVLRRPCIWSAIYRRKMLVENGVCFNETPGASFQDTAFAFQALISAKSIVFVKDAYLHYRIDNETSSTNDGGKVFAVCDEFALMDSYLNVNSDRKRVFAGILNVLRLDTYWWNYHRISDEHLKDSFGVRAASEFEKAHYDQTLDLNLFDRDRKKMLSLFFVEPE